jgi:hypothetical protein
MKAKTSGLEARVAALEAEVEKLKVRLRWLGEDIPETAPYHPKGGENCIWPIRRDIPTGIPIGPFLYPTGFPWSTT